MKSTRGADQHRSADQKRSAEGAVPARASLKAPATAERGAQSDRIRILIVDESPIFMDGLRHLLEAQPDFDVIGVASGFADAVRLANELRPDILLFDFTMPGLRSLEGLRELIGAAGRAILLTAAVTKSDIIKLLQLGVSGIVPKQSPSGLLHKSIRSVFGGDVWISRDTVKDIAHALTAIAASERPAPPKDFGLSDRELEVLRLVVTGNTNKGIAEQLWIRENTVKHHITSIFDKTGASSRLELTLFALHHGLASNP